MTSPTPEDRERARVVYHGEPGSTWTTYRMTERIAQAIADERERCEASHGRSMSLLERLQRWRTRWEPVVDLLRAWRWTPQPGGDDDVLAERLLCAEFDSAEAKP